MSDLGEQFWREICDGSRQFVDALAAGDVPDILDRVETEPDLVAWTLLRGLSGSGLRYCFAVTRSVFELRRGDPYPLVDGPIPRLVPLPTPRVTGTLSYTHLLYGTGFELHEGSDGAAVRINLDFSRRAIIDAALWGTDEHGPHPPLLGSVHPYDAFEGVLEVASKCSEWWFDVRPVAFEAEPIISALRGLAEKVRRWSLELHGRGVVGEPGSSKR